MINKIDQFKNFLLAKKTTIIIILLFLGVLFSYYYMKSDNSDLEIVENTEKEDIKQEKEERKDVCVVDVKGYVNNIGLYEVDCNSRVNDVITLAGGLKENANTSVINLGKKVFDSMVIIIYSNDEVENFTKTKEIETKQEEKCITSSVVGNDACIKKEDRVETNVIVSESVNDNIITNKESNLISINIATKEELMTLPGIGEAKALAIIKYREENGPFTKLDDLKNVTGIGDKMFEKIKYNIML